MIVLFTSEMQKSSKMLDSLHYLSSLVSVDQKITCPYLSALPHFFVSEVNAFNEKNSVVWSSD